MGAHGGGSGWTGTWFPAAFIIVLLVVLVVLLVLIALVVLVIAKVVVTVLILCPPSPWPRRDACKPPLSRYRGHTLGAQCRAPALDLAWSHPSVLLCLQPPTQVRSLSGSPHALAPYLTMTRHCL